MCRNLLIPPQGQTRTEHSSLKYGSSVLKWMLTYTTRRAERLWFIKESVGFIARKIAGHSSIEESQGEDRANKRRRRLDKDRQ